VAGCQRRSSIPLSASRSLLSGRCPRRQLLANVSPDHGAQVERHTLLLQVHAALCDYDGNIAVYVALSVLVEQRDGDVRVGYALNQRYAKYSGKGSLCVTTSVSQCMQYAAAEGSHAGVGSASALSGTAEELRTRRRAAAAPLAVPKSRTFLVFLLRRPLAECSPPRGQVALGRGRLRRLRGGRLGLSVAHARREHVSVSGRHCRRGERRSPLSQLSRGERAVAASCGVAQSRG
jgi:hypothetical protein